MDAKVLVAAHKVFPMPADKKTYLPILVGAVKNFKQGIKFQRDDKGKNISEKNPHYNELTAMYWAWKNFDTSDAIGLVQYRRFFKSYEDENGPLTDEEIADILKTTDIILPTKRHYYIETNYSHYIHAHKSDPLDKLRYVIATYYPDYLDSFDKVMHRRSAHMFNMFIMKKQFFDQYSQFLFNALDILEQQLDISDYSQQDSRVYGYLGELLMDVWVEKNRVRYTEVRWYEVGPKHLLKKYFYFFCRKFGLEVGKTHF